MASMVKAIFCFFVMFFFKYTAFTQVTLTIDTAYFQKADSIVKDSCHALCVAWNICNTGKTAIRDFNPPWYLYPEEVVTDSVYVKNPDKLDEKILKQGIGNTRVILKNDGQLCSILSGRRVCNRRHC